MNSMVLSSPDHMPRSNEKHPDGQICNAKHSENQIPNVEYPCEQVFDLGLDFVGMGAAERASKIKDRVTLDGGLVESRVILGEGLVCCSGVSISVGLTANSSITPMAEAPVTPLTERENGRRCSLTSHTPLTIVSCHSYSNNGDCCSEWSEKVEEKSCSSVEDTPEHSTFDPFASGPNELVFAPKKPFKGKIVLGNSEDADIDGHDASKKLTSTKKHYKIRASRSSVARVLCFDVEDESDGVGCNAHTGPSLDQHGSGELCRNEQRQKERSGSRSKVVRSLDLDYDKHSTVKERCQNVSVNGSDKLLISPRENILLEEIFVETMCGSFLQAILSNHYEDANMNHNDDNFSHGPDQSAPATPVETKVISSVVDSCPGAPMKAKPKARTRVAGFGSVCRKLEF